MQKLYRGEAFYHKEVIEQEDLPLMQAQFLEFVGIWHFKQAAVTYQSTMGQGQHLRQNNLRELNKAHINK